MWFLNKETGLKWEVVDQELMLRLQGNANYEQVDDPKQETKQAKRNEKEVTT
ncbi:hypothetical protein [Paenibacillus sp. A3]|uniref:hypothetical protein n=1 Tax=Paenibacillus sp. A3 TaxID=1337054 RepID=UPI000A49F5FD|nr:hypothetical protein [Paenibacillus sp. A3]